MQIDPRLREGVRVLVVEDDVDLLTLIAEMLVGAGLQVQTATTAEAALEFIDGSEPPSVLLTDVVLPVMQGDELLRQTKANNPATPVIVMSAINSVEQAVALLKLGADDYLTKPLDLDHLLARIAHALESIAVAREIDGLETVYRAMRPQQGVVWGTSPAMISAVSQIPMMARSEAPVVILGESGVGKEIVARAIHYASRRASGPMVSLNTAAVPESLWEREFFGHVAGAFSDARDGAPGIIESANGGTLFLDEIGDVPLAMQAKLLRFLQEKEYRRVGDTTVRRSNVRIISATHRDLEIAVTEGRFREDLYYRLCVLPLHVPPLRERKEDIAALATHFMFKYAEDYDKDVIGFSPRALHRLASHDFPGNIRELENVVQQALAKTRYSVIGADDLSVGDPSITEPRANGLVPVTAVAMTAATIEAPMDDAEDPSLLSLSYADAKEQVLSKFERHYVKALLETHNSNVTHAARAAKMTRKTLSLLIKRHALVEDSPELAPRPGRPPAAD